MIMLELGKQTYNNVKFNQYDRNYDIYMSLNNYTFISGDKFKIEWCVNEQIALIQTDYITFDSNTNILTVRLLREATYVSGVGYFNLVVYNTSTGKRTATFKNQYIVVSNSIDENTTSEVLMTTVKERLDTAIEQLAESITRAEELTQQIASNDIVEEVENARGGYTVLGDRLNGIDSSLDNIVLEKATKVEVDIERKRIDSFVSLPEGSTTGDAELIDGRIGADTKKYVNIGTAIRTQVLNLENNINEKNALLGLVGEDLILTWELGKYKDDGKTGANDSTARCKKRLVDGVVELKVSNPDTYKSLKAVFYDENIAYLYTIDINNNFAILHKGYIAFQTCKADNSVLTDCLEEIKNDFCCKVYKNTGDGNIPKHTENVNNIPLYIPTVNGDVLNTKLDNFDYYKYPFTPTWGHEYLTAWYKKIYEGGDGTKVSVALAGDSITEGYNSLYSGVDDAFVGMRDRWLKKIMKVGGFPLANLNVVNTGHGGKTTNEFVGNESSNAGSNFPYGYVHNAMGHVINSFTPSLVIIAYGMNDANRNFSTTTIEERLKVYEDNMTEALERIRGSVDVNGRPSYNKSLSELAIIICNPTVANIRDTGRANDIWFQHIRLINQKLCRKYHCAFADLTMRTYDHLADGSNNWATLNTDGTQGNIHPNKWADANIFSTLQDLIFPVGLWNIDIDS